MNYKEDINELLARYFAKEELSRAEQEKVEEWITANNQEFELMKKVIQAPLQQTDTVEFNTQKAWDKINPRLEEHPRRRRLNPIISIAASILVVLGLGLFYWFPGGEKNDFNRYANNGIEVKQIMLPDSSEVVLYPSSTLTYNRVKTGRQVELQGKAFFKVKKMNGLPFSVDTRTIQVEVLGTSFLVDVDEENNGGVFVRNGKVKVSMADKEVIIEKNEKVEVRRGQLQEGVIDDPESFFKAFQVVMIFEATSVKDVVREIEKNTGIHIEVGAGLEKNLITTRIEGENGEEIMKELSFLCGCKYQTIEEGKHYRLYNAE